ncbi:MAG: tryptophan-rich sensory protein [Cytophagales bacterium]|nr:MAG: tryptophan-rich sensory protein [Cytophagales bacterium]
MNTNRLWRIATAVFAVGSIVYTARSSSRSRRDSIQDNSKQEYDVPVEYSEVFEKNLIIPAGWAFGVVWSTVYSGLTALLVHQALPAQEHNPRYQKALPWWWSSFALNALFGRFFSESDERAIVASDLVTKLNLPSALALHHALEIGKTDVPAAERYLRIPVSLYSGWLTAATVVGTPDTLLTANMWERDNERDMPLSAGILGATGVVGYVVARQLNDPWYMVPFIAGFGGVASRHWNKPGKEVLAFTAAALAATYVGLAAYWVPKKTFRPYERSVRDADYEIVLDESDLDGSIYSGQHHETQVARERQEAVAEFS